MDLCIPINPISRIMEPGNNLCFTAKRYNYTLSDKTVSKVVRGNTILYKVPCILVRYIKDLQTFLDESNIVTAIKKTCEKYNIVIQKPINNVKRYRYPIVSPLPIVKTLFFKHTYILSGDASAAAALYISNNQVPIDTIVPYGGGIDSLFINIVNDDTKTFSTDYNDIIKSYFGKTLTSQTFPIVVQCKYTNKSVFPQVGWIVYDSSSNRLLYIPFQILKIASLYQTFPNNSSVLFNFIPDTIINAPNYVLPNIYT